MRKLTSPLKSVPRENRSPASPCRVAFVSLGCAKNLVDSERMLAMLAEAGCAVTADVHDADVAVVNTCGFIESARQESLAAIREVAAAKGSGSLKRVVAAGCLCTREKGALQQQIPQLDAVIGVEDREQIVAAVLGSGASVETDERDCPRLRLTPRSYAYLRIAEGCGHKCTYCTIPAIRGPYRSKPIEKLLAEANELVADGAKELVLIAQDTTSYGLDRPEWRRTLVDVIDALETIDSLQWIRLMYAHPGHVGEELIERLADGGKLVPYLDLPIQHIDDDVLRRMGRGASGQRIEQLLRQLRHRIPALTLRTTVIVGFPGETDAAFDRLLQLVQDFQPPQGAPLDALGAFAYSAEPGTPAATMPEPVPEPVKVDRLNRLMQAQQAVAFAAASDMKGRKLNVLVDQVPRRGPTIARYYGQAPEVDGVCLLMPGKKKKRLHPGEMFEVEVAGSRDYDLLVRACVS